MAYAGASESGVHASMTGVGIEEVEFTGHHSNGGTAGREEEESSNADDQSGMVELDRAAHASTSAEAVVSSPSTIPIVHSSPQLQDVVPAAISPPFDLMPQPTIQHAKRPVAAPTSSAEEPSPPKRPRLQFILQAGSDADAAYRMQIDTNIPSSHLVSPSAPSAIAAGTSTVEHLMQGETTILEHDSGCDTALKSGSPYLPSPQTSDPPSLQSSLRPLPLPIQLLVQAHIYKSALVTPNPTIFPSSTAQSSYGNRWVEWMRKSGAAVAALRSVIAKSGNSAGVSGGRLVLRARCELAEILIRDMEGSAEVEQVISKGLAAAKKHNAFSDYKYRLYSLQAELSVAQGNIKFAKSTIKRAIAELLASPILTFPSWLYHYYLTLASISANDHDYPGALSSWRDVERLAEQRADVEMKWASKVMMARLALGEREFRTAGVFIAEVAKMMGLSSELEAKSEVTSATKQEEKKKEMGVDVLLDEGFLGRQLRVQFLLVYCLYHAQNGNVKLAKEKLKLAHVLLDEKHLDDGEAEGWTTIPVRSGDDVPSTSSSSSSALGSSPSRPSPSQHHSTAFVQIATSPRALIYSFAFLASVAIHRDPYGSKPRSKLFANEGLRTLDNKLNGNEHWMPSQIPPNEISLANTTVAKMKVDLLLFSAELDILRSSFASAESLLASAISTARSHIGLWESFQRRITLAHGTLAQARDQDQLAMRCFKVVINLPGAEREKDLVRLAKASILMLRISKGDRVRCTDEGSPGGGQEMKELDRMARELGAIAGEEGAAPSLKLMAEFVMAMTKGEIIKAKLHLSTALSISNASLANHAKALMLALLANLFLHTRNDQAQKMLKAAYTILRGMGARAEGESAVDKENAVGNARLGLWVGERLLESFERDDTSKVSQQRQVNEAHRKAVAALAAGAAEASFPTVALSM